MDLNLNKLVLEALSKPPDAIYASLSHSLTVAFPTRFVGEVESEAKVLNAARLSSSVDAGRQTLEVERLDTRLGGRV